MNLYVISARSVLSLSLLFLAYQMGTSDHVGVPGDDLDRLVETGGGPCAEPEVNEECCDPLVMSAMDVGGKSGGGFAILGPAPLGQPLWATLSTGPHRLLCLQQHLCGIVDRTQPLESASSGF